jgi:2-dehydropantoate 2-reductase
VVGTGSVGGTIGGALAESGHDVVLFARGAHLEALQSSGLTLMTPPSRTLKPSVWSVAGPEELEPTPDDVLIFFVKSQDTLPLLARWSARPVSSGGTAGELLPLMCAQNGVANEFDALRYFEHVYGMCVWLPVSMAEPGVVVAEAVPKFGILDLGRVDGALAWAARPGDGETGHVLAAELTRAGFAAYVTDDVMSWKYGKLLRNLANAV